MYNTYQLFPPALPLNLLNCARLLLSTSDICIFHKGRKFSLISGVSINVRNIIGTLLLHFTNFCLTKNDLIERIFPLYKVI